MINKKTLFLVLLIFLLAPTTFISAQCVAGVGNVRLNAMLTAIQTMAIGVGMGLTVIGFVVAGIMWLVSGGSPEKTGTAKKALIAAVIGAALVAIAQGANVFQDIICKTLGL